MRLYLSSYQLGSHPEEFVDLVSGGRAGWVIMNALDGASDQQRRVDDVGRQINQLAAIGLRARNVDLRDGFESADRPDYVWVRGGNVFTLRMAMARSGFDAWVSARILQDDVVYAGFSAGPCVLAPSLHGLERCDPTDDAIAAYGEVRFDGLGILDRPVVPHLDSPGHPETDLLAAVAASYDAAGQRYWALRDGQALVVDDQGERIV
ncbi:Type 1 glutamine amidotransferase-like domain-containing protein [Branchiibius sp. NY16-3462-2]|uniref:Type 1 glutamine amidotransferase-like domain-containing protein n=1 Tax=Branchiibius sp. NY16-3462-2 TaxID=1807500 RepID=UPI000B1954CA|nr:Type 1 glutamine amidotransferase-like domain-containing protein [Branchiibius sp. NY16-3462-2]